MKCFKNFTTERWVFFVLGIFFFIGAIPEFFLSLNLHGLGEGITAFLIRAFPAFFLFYLAFRKNIPIPEKQEEENKANNIHSPTNFRFGTKFFITLFIFGVFCLRWLNVLFGKHKNKWEILISLPIFYIIVSLIWKKDWKNCSLFQKIIYFFGFLEILILTALSYEILPTPIVLIVLGVDILLWFIQISIIKKLFLKVKNLYIYWIWNISSPIWSLWINGYENEGSGSQNYYGSILYVIGALCIILFILKKNLFAQEVEKIRKSKAS